MTVMQGAQDFVPGAQDGRDFVDLVSGTVVLTLDGALPAEHLLPGDRIITRGGMRRLAGISSRARGAAGAVSVGDVRLWAEQPVHLRGAVAVLDCGRPAADVAAGRIGLAADEAQMPLRLIRLQFDGPVVIYADGLELASRPGR